ncbi:uncharacterized protein LOC111263338 [Varroa jacobsoni]|uniref:Uncharacterized protein n=1 Tax=Varroa destructor TaxID=109461 RepID=A0A7M7K0J0_VARDE|nr:uncharacterized protein LOC111249220 [Varroa destructor]XP_022694052.1 uncharacterized protein LOC111263338 [Varroa jacobsoni]
MAALIISCSVDDPWQLALGFGGDSIVCDTESAGETTSAGGGQHGGFEDNFEPFDRVTCCSEVIEKEHDKDDTIPRFKMPDSQRYLNNLEDKLRRLKMSKKSERDEARRMVSELGLHKKGRWENAMQDVTPIGFSADEPHDDPYTVPFIVRMLYPERSPLRAEELQKLVDNDCLTAFVSFEGDPVTLSPETASSPRSSSPKSTGR